MKRCRAKGLERFEVLVGAAVLANNLLRIAEMLRTAKPVRRKRQHDLPLEAIILGPSTVEVGPHKPCGLPSSAFRPRSMLRTRHISSPCRSALKMKQHEEKCACLL